MTSQPDPATILTPQELDVLCLRNVGIGRRRGSAMLGISEDAWRWRLASALRKIDQETTANRKENAA